MKFINPFDEYTRTMLLEPKINSHSFFLLLPRCSHIWELAPAFWSIGLSFLSFLIRDSR
jgi:hypothetical protein